MIDYPTKHQNPPDDPLEDDPCDVISKAMQGLEISASELAAETGISMTELESILQGQHRVESLKRIALALQLDSKALIDLPLYKPVVNPPKGLYRFISPFGHAGVNAYVITVGKKAIIFDTGTDASPILQFLTSRQLEIDTLCITHHHYDHTSGITDLHPTRILYPEDTQHGETIPLTDGHHLTALDVSGHLTPARAYLYDHLETPVCIIGDSIFAGSMGKTPNLQCYQLSLQTARDHLMTLPETTVLCPGHGPLTTVQNERQSNPFLN